MSARKPAPIGPLALAMRHVRGPSGARRIAAITVVLGLALAAGIVVLLLR
jgi:hypothetical protein